MAYVYIHKRKDTNEVFYVGIGQNKNRAFEKTRRNPFWKRITKITDFDVHIIEENLSWKEACEREKYWISFYGRRNINTGSLVNLTDGGDGTLGRIVSEETRNKMRRPISEEHKRKIGLASKGRNVGRKHTEEARKKMSNASKGRNVGRKHTEEARKKMSNALKGKTSWMKGKTQTEETKKKISDSLKKNPVSYWKGKTRSEETKEKIRETFRLKNLRNS
jgi:hypothetical protein